MNEEKRVALLIDAENVSAQYADRILEEVSNYGICSYKRIYGAWDRIVQTKWESQINKYSLKPIMLFNNIKGKTATDTSLIIDAMDILYKGPMFSASSHPTATSLRWRGAFWRRASR